MKILSVFGTRPEAIKMAPVVLGMNQHPDFESVVCVTGQHREMLDQALQVFDIQPDIDLDLMTSDQNLSDITAAVLRGVGPVIRDHRPDAVLVHGDTATCFAAALAAFYEKVPVGHVEAGLRTGDVTAPFPEEAYRSMVGRLARWHFAPTQKSRSHLLSENIPDSRIFVTGNTAIDALRLGKDMLMHRDATHWAEPFGTELFHRIVDSSRRLILVTGHRRENVESGFNGVFTAIQKLAIEHPNWDIVYCVHMNPKAQSPAKAALHGLANVTLIKPQDYLSFLWLMEQSDVILTDSGGIQEEAPSLGKPVLVMRDVTERQEALGAGTVTLVGTDEQTICAQVENILLKAEVYEQLPNTKNPYGDGYAAERILKVLAEG